MLSLYIWQLIKSLKAFELHKVIVALFALKKCNISGTMTVFKVFVKTLSCMFGTSDVG